MISIGALDFFTKPETAQTALLGPLEDCALRIADFGLARGRSNMDVGAQAKKPRFVEANGRGSKRKPLIPQVLVYFSFTNRFF